METDPTPPANAVAKPVPPEGYRLITDAEKLHPLPSDVLCAWLGGSDNKTTWHPSAHRGVKLPESHLSHHYATAEPTPSGPTAGDSMDVHYAELKAENAVLRAALGIDPDWTVPKQTPQFSSILVDRPGGRARISPATDNEQALAHALAAAEQERNKAVEFAKESDNGKWQRMKVAENESDDLRAELEKVRKTAVELVTAAETKAGAMETRIVRLNRLYEMTLANQIQWMDRHTAALARAESAEAALRSAQGLVKGYTYGGALYAYIELTKAIEALPPAPSVASEKEQKLEAEVAAMEANHPQDLPSLKGPQPL